MDLSLQQLFWAFDVLLLALPVSVVALECFRLRKAEEVVLLCLLIAYALLEFSAHFMATWPLSYKVSVAYRISNGALFAGLCWMLIAEDTRGSRSALALRGPAVALAVAAVIAIYISWREPLMVSRAFGAWQLLICVMVGYLAVRNKEHRVPFILAAILCWFLGHISHEYFFAIFFAIFAYIILVRRITNVVEVDTIERLLLREKETTFKLINEIGSSVRDITTSDETVNLILHSAIEASHASAGAIYIYESAPASNERFLVPKAVEGPFTPLHASDNSSSTFTDADALDVDQELIQEREIKIGESILSWVSDSRTSLLIEDARQDYRIQKLGGSALNIRTLVAVPVQMKNELLGLLVCINKTERRHFTPDDSSVLQTLADQAALSVNNAKLYSSLSEQERIHRELEIAKEIQMRLLPKSIPIVNGINVAATMTTAREVGGDYYDCIKIDDNKMGLVIGDVAGKGLPAGMIVLIVRTVLHILVHEILSAKKLIAELSQRVYSQMESREFMTFLYLLWDAGERVIRYASAGHEHILHYQKSQNKVNRIRSGGVAIGMHPEIEQFLNEREIKVGQGDVVILYTDGITEAKKPNGDMFGLNRLQRVLEENPQKAPEEIKQIVLREIDNFTGEVEQYDDMTLMILKFL